MPDLSDIRRVLRVAERRLRAERTLRWLHRCGVAAAGVVLALALVDRAGPVPIVPWTWTAAGLAAAVAVATWRLQRRGRPGELAVAVLVDERLGLRERLSNALQAAGASAEGTAPPSPGVARVVVEDGLAAARDPRVREAVGRRFAVRGPRRGWVAPLLLAVAVGILQLPQADLLADAGSSDEDRVEVADARDEARAAVEAVTVALESSPELAAELGDLAEELTIPEALAAELEDPEDLRREAIKRLTRTGERLEALLAGDEAAAMESLEATLAGLEPTDGPARALAEALRAGDFAAASRAIERMMTELESGAVGPEQAERLAEQLADLAEQLEALAEQQAALEDALAEAGLDPRLAASPEAMREAIEQSEALNEQQKQELARRLQAMQQAQRMAREMGGACRSLGEAMQGTEGMAGASGRAGAMAAAGAMADRLSDLEAMQQMLGQARSVLAQCRGGGPGMGAGAMAGMGPQGGARGGGANANPVSAAPGRTVARREQVETRAGEVIARMLIDGEATPGESRAVLREVVRAQARGVDETIEQSRLPRRYHASIKHYFGRLQRQVEAADGGGGGATGGDGGSVPRPRGDEGT